MEVLSEGLSNLSLQEEEPASDLEQNDNGDKDFDLDPDSPSKGKDSKSVRPRFPLRSSEPDCLFYVRNGSCRFGMKCKFNHPPRKKRSKGKMSKNSEADQTSQDNQTVTIRESLIPTEDKNLDDKFKEAPSERAKQKDYEKNQDATKEEPKGRLKQKESQVFEETEKPIPKMVEKVECKYFSLPGGCKYGKSCKYIHNETKTELQPVELNFLGLPIRPGEKECPYYMRTGSCKYATNCKFHHPDPTAEKQSEESAPVVQNLPPAASSHSSHSHSSHIQIIQPVAPHWAEPRPMHEPVPYLVASSSSYAPGMIPPHGMIPSQEWNGYQVPVNPYFAPGVHIQNYPPANMNVNHVNHAMYNATDIAVVNLDEYPERPGQPECQYFMKNGSCKFKLACKYHHPRSRIPSASTGSLGPMGLPLKPDQPVCTHYGMYGVCKYGPACKYDHPVNYGSPAPTAFGSYSS